MDLYSLKRFKFQALHGSFRAGLADGLGGGA